MQNIAVLEAGDGIAEIGFALLCRTTDYGLQTTEGKAGIRNYGFAELRKLASLCYAGQRTTDNRQRRAKPAFGTTDSRNYGNWLRFAMPDNGLQTTEAMPELRNYGITELRKIGFALLCRTTDYRQRTTEGKAGIRNYGTTEATPDNGQQTTEDKAGSLLTTHCTKILLHYYITFLGQQTMDNGGR